MTPLSSSLSACHVKLLQVTPGMGGCVHVDWYVHVTWQVHDCMLAYFSTQEVSPQGLGVGSHILHTALMMMMMMIKEIFSGQQSRKG